MALKAVLEAAIYSLYVISEVFDLYAAEDLYSARVGGVNTGLGLGFTVTFGLTVTLGFGLFGSTAIITP